MPLVECKVGHAETHVAGTTYVFDRDKYGRYVAQVHRHEDVACLISVDHYRIVSEVPPEADKQPEATEHDETKNPDPTGAERNPQGEVTPVPATPPLPQENVQQPETPADEGSTETGATGAEWADKSQGEVQPVSHGLDLGDSDGGNAATKPASRTKSRA